MMSARENWYLVDGQQPTGMPATELHGGATYLRIGKAVLPVLPSGLIHEIICSTDKPEAPPDLTVRRLGRFERTWRMAWRVLNSWLKLNRLQRRSIGLTLLRAIADLPAAYRAATTLRGYGYAHWCAEVDRLQPADVEAIKAHIASWTNKPSFIIRKLPGDVDAWAETLMSLDAQLYRNFFLEERDPEPDEWLILLQPGDRLPPHALYWVAHVIRQASPAVRMVYWDDDEVEEGQRCHPRFKPDWSLHHLRETDYIGRAVAIKGSALYEAGGLQPLNRAGDTWELLLRVGEQAEDRVWHIPAVLLHREAATEKKSAVVIRRVRYPLPEPAPLVSVIVPTRDAVQLLRQCVESLLDKTDYPRFELLVVDNGSRDAEALAYLAELRNRQQVRVLRWDRPFNFSAINNFAAGEAQGQVLCLLNNDTEVITPDWLTEMVSQLNQPGVGVVGAKLFYPDGRVQHAGDTVGPGGCANHLHQFIAGDDPGYCNRAIVAQELSAVTAACMVTWRKLYLQLGGLKERWLPVAFNDVDYCLRVRQAGYKVIFTPHAQLYHHESVSRGKDRGWRKEFRAWREVRYMRWKWRAEMKNDPFYNPNFSYLRADFVLSPAPNVRRPWR